MNCGCQTYTCPEPNVELIAPVISSLNNLCCSPLTRDKVLFDAALTGEDMSKIIAVSNCGVDITAPDMPDCDSIDIEKVLNPCSGMDAFQSIELGDCECSCVLAVMCAGETVHIPGSCQEGVCTYYRITYCGDETTRTFISPPTTESKNRTIKCGCSN